MDIKIDSTIPKPSDDELEDMMERSRSIEDATPEEFEKMRAEMAGVKTVIIPDHLLETLTEMGLSPDELVSMLLGKLKVTQ